mgnify:CR=1 FL=1
MMSENEIIEKLERIKARAIGIKIIKEEYQGENIDTPEKVQKALRKLGKMVLNLQIDITNIKTVLRATQIGRDAIDSGKLGYIHKKLQECIEINKQLL